MMQKVDSSTPIAMLTVGQLVEVLSEKLPSKVVETVTDEKRYVYGMKGIAQIFGCSIPTANRIKASGKISGAIRQIGRKIVVDADLALELAGRKNGGRR